eukprot:8998220-Prorocentrum_lima.AAC.1
MQRLVNPNSLWLSTGPVTERRSPPSGHPERPLWHTTFYCNLPEQEPFGRILFKAAKTYPARVPIRWH